MANAEVDKVEREECRHWFHHVAPSLQHNGSTRSSKCPECGESSWTLECLGFRLIEEPTGDTKL